MQLTIDSLFKTYTNGVCAINNVTLTLTNGMFGLLGPNGAGKSSLMRTIATLQNADTGSIRLDGLDVLKEKTDIPGKPAKAVVDPKGLLLDERPDDNAKEL